MGYLRNFESWVNEKESVIKRTYYLETSVDYLFGNGILNDFNDTKKQVSKFLWYPKIFLCDFSRNKETTYVKDTFLSEILIDVFKDSTPKFEIFPKSDDDDYYYFYDHPFRVLKIIPNMERGPENPDYVMFLFNWISFEKIESSYFGTLHSKNYGI